MILSSNHPSSSDIDAFCESSDHSLIPDSLTYKRSDCFEVYKKLSEKSRKGKLTARKLTKNKITRNIRHRPVMNLHINLTDFEGKRLRKNYSTNRPKSINHLKHDSKEPLSARKYENKVQNFKLLKNSAEFKGIEQIKNSIYNSSKSVTLEPNKMSENKFDLQNEIRKQDHKSNVKLDKTDEPYETEVDLSSPKIRVIKKSESKLSQLLTPSPSEAKIQVPSQVTLDMYRI